MKIRKFATFNCQGLLNQVKRMNIADDFIHFGLSAMMIQETHIKGNGIHELKTSSGETLHLYNSGHENKSTAGVAVLVKSNCEVNFDPICERICVIKMKTNDITNNLISAYAPTLDTTKKHPEETQKFYDMLTSVVNKIKRRETIIIGGDFNAKTKVKVKDNALNKIVGNYAKSDQNENGEKLIEFCNIHDLRITNTFFKHKPIHQTTWKSPATYINNIDAKTKQPRRNPYRNQIDYILVKNNNNIKIFDSRAYTSQSTKSDHKPVIAKLKIKWQLTRNKNTSNKQINISKFQNTIIREEYKHFVTTELNKNVEQPTSNQERWNKITNILKTAAEHTVGYKNKKVKSDNEDIQYLSQLQRTTSTQIESEKHEERKKGLKKLRNRIMTEIHNILKHEQNEKIRQALEDLENIPDNNKMYEAVKRLQKLKPPQQLLIKGEDGLTVNQTKQVKIIAKYFKETFFKNAEPMPNIDPRPMSKPFTTNEIMTAVKRMKTNKTPGCDDIQIELIKHAPNNIIEAIAEIYNNLSETGDCPKEIKHGLLRPLQKPGKAKGPPSNLRPIILLSALRKILAACIMSRIKTRLDYQIPSSQAAYRPKRSTTEHVFACKLVIERTISAKNETVFLLLLDMSKAFDSIDRNTLIHDLQSTIDPDELHIVKNLLDVDLAVKCGNTISDTFMTNTGHFKGTAQVQTSLLSIWLKHYHQHQIRHLQLQTTNMSKTTSWIRKSPMSLQNIITRS